jgi:hypothetical protein
VDSGTFFLDIFIKNCAWDGYLTVCWWVVGHFTFRYDEEKTGPQKFVKEVCLHEACRSPQPSKHKEAAGIFLTCFSMVNLAVTCTHWADGLMEAGHLEGSVNFP